MTYADTLARRIDLQGCILDPWEDDEEQAVFVHVLGHYAPVWQYEAEPGIEPSAEPVSADADAAILSWLREHGVGTARYMAMDLWRFGGRAVCKARLEAMCRAGRVVRTPAGWYRAA